MKVDETQKMITVSRRNLEALLRKLDGSPQDSACTIGGGTDAPGWHIKAEENDVHYAERPAGRMIADTEIHISKPETGTEDYSTPPEFWLIIAE